VTRLTCADCATQIETNLEPPPILRLPAELLSFLLTFVRCRGSIRDVERELGISYPTVCKRLDLVNELLGHGVVGTAVTEESPGAPDATAARPRVNRDQVLDRLERGEITPAEAAALLRTVKTQE
jgi:hypothetical protein